MNAADVRRSLVHNSPPSCASASRPLSRPQACIAPFFRAENTRNKMTAELKIYVISVSISIAMLHLRQHFGRCILDVSEMKIGRAVVML
jgi:hypothetical protein